MITPASIMFFSNLFIISLTLGRIIFEVISSLVDSGIFWWGRSIRYYIQGYLTSHWWAFALQSIIWEVCLCTIVPRNIWLFNTTTKILPRYHSDKRQKPSSTNRQNILSMQSFMVPYHLHCPKQKTKRGPVVMLWIFWIIQMDFRELI